MAPDRNSVPRASAFAALLRAHRRARGLTQDEFAARAGVGVRTVRDLERGRSRPQRATAELLAAALGLVGAERDEFMAAGRPGGPAAEREQVIGLPPAPPLIGREAELAELDAALRHAALVTLVGVAGVGKTSLGLAAAHRIAGRHPGGVAGIAVTEVSTEQDVISAVATVFEVPQAADLPARLSGRPALLLVDAIERSAEPTAAAMRWLQAKTPSLRMIATGRHPSGLAGEYVWPVVPLEVPPPGLVDLPEMSRYPAAELFLERLRQLGQIQVEASEAAAVAELVRRLGGLPLALELAAARGRILAVGEILDRYGDRILDLAGANQRGETITLREAIAASYRLLEPAERWSLRQLSQFSHRWSVELAEPLLAEPPGQLGPARDVVALLDRLTGLGLVNIRGTGPARFRLLDMVRDFAREQCAIEEELPVARRRHARVIRDYAARIAPDLVGSTLPDAVGRLDDVAMDLRAALVSAADDEPVTALVLAAKLPRWWRFRGQDRQGREWLRRLLDDPRTAGADPVVRAWAKLGLAQLAAEHGDALVGLPELEEALRTFIERADITGQLAARNQLCVLHQALGNHEAAREHGEAVLALATRTGRTRDVVVAQNNLTWHEIRVGDLEAARRRLTAVQRLAAELGEYRLRALAHANLAEVARLDGRYADAVVIGRRAMVLLEELGDPGHRSRVHGVVGLALAQMGRVDQARQALEELGNGDGLASLIRAYLALGDGNRGLAAKWFAEAADALAGRRDVRDVVEAMVGLAASTEDPGQRVGVVAELERIRARSGISLLTSERAMLDRSARADGQGERR